MTIAQIGPGYIKQEWVRSEQVIKTQLQYFQNVISQECTTKDRFQLMCNRL